MPVIYGREAVSTGIMFPPSMIRGDSWSFSLVSERYGSGATDGPWTATATFASGLVRLEADAVLETNRFKWDILPEQTLTLFPGPASYVVQVTNGTLRRTLESGVVTVSEDITIPGAVIDPNSALEKELAAADACLLALLSQRTSMVSFGGKQYQLWNIKDLWAVRNGIYSRAMAERERTAGNMRARIIMPVFLNV
jgi:hypothetical protein